jgi:polysaccharide biosynthesis/export protein
MEGSANRLVRRSATIKRGFMSIRFCNRSHLLLLAILGASVACLIRTAAAQEPDQAIAEDTSAKDDSSSPLIPASSPSVPVDANYVIGADDVLAVDVWHEKELSRVLSVRPDGKISLPFIGELKVAGQTPLQLQDTITDRLKAYLAHPQVAVMVQETKSQKVNVVGEVQRPGEFVFGHPITVLDAIALAGGLRDFAKAKKMYVIRTAPDGSQQRLRVNYKDVVKGKRPQENLTLQSHDTVVVP